MSEEKDTLEEARNALHSMLAGVGCTPMEREFFIRGYFLGKYSQSFVRVLDPVAKTDRSTIDLFG